METNGEWIDCANGEYMAMDAMGVILDNVESVRVTDLGIEVICVAVTPEGSELVCSPDDGVTFEPVRARLDIPGGMFEKYEEV